MESVIGLEVILGHCNSLLYDLSVVPLDGL